MNRTHASGATPSPTGDETPQAGVPSPVEPADDELLRRYRSDRDDAAFALLVKRYAPLVWRVCCRTLGNIHDAEDAFQATFVVLVRKAGSIRWRKSIAGWIHEASCRVAKKSRAAASRRVAAAPTAALAVASSPAPDDAELDRRLAVEEEIARLPEAMRLAVVMCYLQGLTNAQAARLLGCGEGTIAARLSRAREKLRRRLKARGVAMVGGAALAGWLAEGVSAAIAARLPECAAALTSLSGSAVGSAIISSNVAQLAGEVTRQLARRQLLQLAAAIALGTAVVAPWLVYKLGLWSIADAPDAPPAAATNNVMVLLPFDELDPPIKAALSELQGEWILEQWTVAGQELPVDPESQRIRFEQNRCVLINLIGNRPGPVDGYVVLDHAAPGRFLDLLVILDDQPTHMRCLYEVSDDELRLAIAPASSARPTELNAQRGGANTAYRFGVFKRSPAARPRDTPSP